MIKNLLKKTFLRKVWHWYQAKKNKIIHNYKVPHYDEKRAILLSYKNKYNLNTFIESGTFLGGTIDSLKNNFGKLYSIELSNELARKAMERFKAVPNVTIVQGDSGTVIRQLLDTISDPCLFWLDGHYSSEFFVGSDYIVTARGDKETPILEELKGILLHPVKTHVILIDDARCFTGKNDYPTIDEVATFVKQYNPNLTVSQKRDIIRIVPN